MLSDVERYLLQSSWSVLRKWTVSAELVTICNAMEQHNVSSRGQATTL